MRAPAVALAGLSLVTGLILSPGSTGVSVAAAPSHHGSVAGVHRSKPLGPGTVTVRIRARYSRFSPTRIVVHPGTVIRFEIDNRDPINHEFIVGPPEIHALHEAGTAHVHVGGGEVSVPAKTIGTTSYRFDTPGSVVFACHLPGHFAYGMSGEVVVTR